MALKLRNLPLSVLQALLQLGQLLRKVSGRHSVLLNDGVEANYLLVKSIDGDSSVGDFLLTIRYRLLLLDDLLAEGLYLSAIFSKLLLELAHLVNELFLLSLHEFFGPRLLLLLHRLHRVAHLGLPLFDQSFPLNVELRFERVLRVELFCQQFVVLLVVLLDVSRNLLSVSLL